MRILLPPSEGKRPGGRGRPIETRPAAGPFAPARHRALDALQRLLTGHPDDAAAALLLPAGVAAEALATNAQVRTARTMPALDRYAGVVYDGLSAGSLSMAARRLAARRVFVVSGLWGVLRGDEPIPDYRVPAKAVLPGVGVVGTFWRPVLDAELPALLGPGLIVDLRSSDYAAMWRPRAAVAARTITVRVLSPLPRGGVGVVSYASKLGKGRLAAALLEREAAGVRAIAATDVAEAWLAGGGKDAVITSPTHVEAYTTSATRF